jgi:hypothetical protein
MAPTRLLPNPRSENLRNAIRAESDIHAPYLAGPRYRTVSGTVIRNARNPIPLAIGPVIAVRSTLR